LISGRFHAISVPAIPTGP